MSADKIIIKSLKIPVHIGCSEEERIQAQTLELDIELYLSLQSAGRSANLTDTICYHTVCNQVQELSVSQSWILLEQLAESIADKILGNFTLCDSLKIEIRKFILPATEYTAIEIVRNRK